MAAGDLITSKGYTFTPADVELFVSSLVGKIQSTAKDPGQYEIVRVLDSTITSLPVFRESGNTFKLVRILMSAFKGDKGDAFKYSDFTQAQLDALALTFEKLSPEQVNLLKIKLADLTAEDIASLQKPATDAAKRADDKMVQLSQEVSQAITNTNTVTERAKEAAENADIKAGLADSAASNANTKAGLANTAAKLANEKAGLANTATGNANTAAENANGKATLANNAASAADTAAENANTKAGLADSAASNANTEAGKATTAAGLANTAATNANTKADLANTAANLANSAADRVDTAITNANNATKAANDAAGSVNDAKTAATTAAGLANTAATNANTKAGLADTAATNANNKAGLANAAATNANTAKDTANTAAGNADSKATLANNSATAANTAAGNANTKADLADTAAINANTKADLANTAATNANTEAGKATTAAGLANTAAGLANTAAERANTAAEAAESVVAGVRPDWNETNIASSNYISNKPTSMPASDVSNWAKAATKPTYTYAEVGASPSNHNHTGVYQPVGNYASSSHTHEGVYEPVFGKNNAFNKNFGTTAGTVCEGNDSRLTNSRPASDVSSWAKAASKPTYTYSEVGALAAGGTAVNASKVANTFVLKVNSGTAEGTNLYTFNGSVGKTLDIKAGANVTLTAAAGILTIASTNTVYTHPAYTARASGLYKITVDAAGHVSAVANVVKTDITALGIPAQDTVYTHPSNAGNKHIPAGGSSGQILRWSADGTAAWGADNDTTYGVATQSANGLMSAVDKKRLDFEYGRNDVTTLVSLPVTKRTVNAALSGATSLSLAAALEEGQEMLIRCIPSTAFTQPIPNSGVWTSMSGASFTATANVPFEISIWCYKSGYYEVAILEQD